MAGWSACPGVYDGLHFAHLRTGGRVAGLMDAGSRRRRCLRCAAELARQPADLVFSVFATGALAAASAQARGAGSAHGRAVYRRGRAPAVGAEGTDLFLVTSPAAAASVRRYLPRAAVAVVPPPVRPAFYAAPSQQEARAALGVPASEPCVLVIDSGWGFGPLVASVAALADAGVHVLAVAGRRATVERGLRELARTAPGRVRPFGFTDRVPELMAAADVVVALPGATTCGEARVVGRPLLLLDVMPGHGRDNLLHELELGAASVCVATPAGVTASALAMLDRRPGPAAAVPAPRGSPPTQPRCSGSAWTWARQCSPRWQPSPVVRPPAARPAGTSRHAPNPPSRERSRVRMMRTLFLNPPSFEGFDGGAGARYQARAKSGRTGTRRGWRSRPRSCRAAGSWTRPPAGLALDDVSRSPPD